MIKLPMSFYISMHPNASPIHPAIISGGEMASSFLVLCVSCVVKSCVELLKNKVKALDPWCSGFDDAESWQKPGIFGWTALVALCHHV